ncbi:hypothetical protein [Deinococcus enclensis]|uniref:STAS domain-containing protein n=1 Tax=Deinococcus enclensis TaxID=1049582 RepID=A0ABT9MGA3_9DEIO|nr:hypothetical protein [Deinococcus enclensis]MDP9765239.1 hypothetical protein [Deinococcus enclensis]
MTLPNPRPHVLIRTAAPFAVTQWSDESPHNSETLARTIAAALDACPDGVLLDFAGAVVGDLTLHTAFTTLADTGRAHAGNRHLLDLTGLDVDGREAAAWDALDCALARHTTSDLECSTQLNAGGAKKSMCDQVGIEMTGSVDPMCDPMNRTLSICT